MGVHSQHHNRMPKTHLRNRDIRVHTAAGLARIVIEPVDGTADLLALDEVLLAPAYVGAAAVAEPP